MRLGHRPALDGIRGLAVVAVLASHTGVVGGGFLGVDLFFVLSGFLITSLLAEEHAATGRISFAAFYRRRALRLLPALSLLLVFSTVYALTVAPPAQSAVTLRGVGSSLVYASNLQIAAHGPYALGMLGHTWSLSVEEQFYIVWPALLLGMLAWLGPRRALLPCIGALLAVTAWRTVLYLHGADPGAIFVGSLTHADGLLAGSVLALARAGGVRVPRLGRRSLQCAAACGAVAIAVMMLAFGSRADMLPWGYTAVALCGAAAVAWAVESRAPRNPLTWRPLRAAGRWSYAIYLWNPVAISVVGLGWSHGTPPPWVQLPLAGVITVAVAAASYRYVERPFLRMRRAVRRDQPAPVPLRSVA